MKKFMAVYLGSADGLSKWKAMDEARRKQSETRRISAQGIADTRNEIAAWSIVQAESHDAAARLFENHPHFTIFPGDAIEVMECLPMPEL